MKFMNQMFVNFKRMNVYATDMEPEGSAQRGQQLYGIQTCLLYTSDAADE